jgi:AcrR family transcriptional regulator
VLPRPADSARRATILAAARTLFSERQYARTTMADIAAAADMGVGSLYVYFPTKEAIAATSVESHFGELHEAIIPPLRDLVVAEAVAQGLAAGIEQAKQNLDMLALCRLFPPRHFLPALRRLLEAIEQAVAHQMDQGAFRALDPAFVTHWVNAQIEWIVMRCFVERVGDIEEERRQLTDVIVRAIVQFVGKRAQRRSPMLRAQQ